MTSHILIYSLYPWHIVSSTQYATHSFFMKKEKTVRGEAPNPRKGWFLGPEAPPQERESYYNRVRGLGLSLLKIVDE
jgi:hypothetical protein